MDQRLQLHEALKDLLGSDNVYFQPPQKLQLKYPCIVYELAVIATKPADNKPYSLDRRYTMTYIDSDPDSSVPEELAQLPKCKHTRHFSTSNLHHYVFDIYH